MSAFAWPLDLAGLAEQPPIAEEAGLAAAFASPLALDVLRVVWAQQSVRTFASVTNLGLASARVAVVGTGPLAQLIVRELVGSGARVVVTSREPAGLVYFTLAGVEVVESGALPPDVLFAFVTGEEGTRFDTSAIEPGVETLVLVDAAIEDAAVRGDGTTLIRQGLRQLDNAQRETFVLNVREINDGTYDRVRNAVVSALTDAARTGGDDAAAIERAFARAVIA